MVGRAEIKDFLTYWKQTWQPSITYAELSEQLENTTQDFGPGDVIIKQETTQGNEDYISI